MSEDDLEKISNKLDQIYSALLCIIVIICVKGCH